MGRFVQVDPIGLAAGPNVYAYCDGWPTGATDPTGLEPDWAKFQEGIWGGGQGMTDFLLGMGAGNDLTRDSQGMVNGEADFLSGLLTAAEGLTDNPVFGQVRDAINSARNLANNGMMAMAAFGSIKGLKGLRGANTSSGLSGANNLVPKGATSTPAARGRLARDVSVNPGAPKALPTTRPVGRSAAQNSAAQADVARMQRQGYTDIRVNQQQINASGQRVGINRPDVQGTRRDGVREYIEYDTSVSARGLAHRARTLANDPSGRVVLRRIG